MTYLSPIVKTRLKEKLVKLNKLRFMKEKDELIKVLDCYGIKSKKERRLSGGVINITYEIECDHPESVEGKVIAQCLGSMLNVKSIIDQVNIQTYLEQHNFSVPKLLPVITFEGKSVLINRHIWRLFRYIPHDKGVLKSKETIFVAAKTLGKFHVLLKGLNYRPIFKIQDFHDTRKLILKLIEVAGRKGYEEKFLVVKKEIDFVVSEIEKYYLPEGLLTTLIHGDPKFENFLFKNSQEVAALIDLDTIMVANEMIDLGDALQSWCKIDKTKFNRALFKTALKGYLSENTLDYLSDKTAKNATAMMILELAARFLTDYFKESYFQWDRKKYLNAAAHNLERYKMHIKYYKNFLNAF